MGHIPSLPICTEEFIKKFTEDLTFKKVLSTHTMYTSVLAEIEGDGLVVCKIRCDNFKDKTKDNEMELKSVKRRIEAFQSIVYKEIHPNLLPIEKFETLSIGVTMAFRQYVFHSLKDKLAQVPKIEIIQKKWITFQLIHSLKQLQNLGEFHGNITTENVLITSSDWVFLSDCMFYKKVYLGIDDHQINSAYFGDYINHKRCYIAPERFVKAQVIEEGVSLKDKFAMDIFSLGCVIAEIFRNGRPLFDLPKLMEYKKGNLVIDRDVFESDIKDDDFIIKIILDMIHINPKKRKTIDEYLHLFVSESIDSTSDSFPESFHKTFYPLG